jgi:hypothetical protein
LVALQGAKSIPEDAIACANVRVGTVDVASSGNWNLSARIGLFVEIPHATVAQRFE